jgi:hypothetical protein
LWQISYRILIFMEPYEREVLMTALRSTETCEQGRIIIYQKADAIDVELAEAIREESLLPGLGDRAVWFVEWYKDAQGAVFISQCLAAIVAATDPRFGVHEYIEEQMRLDRPIDLEVLHHAVKILLAFAPKTIEGMQDLISRSDGIISSSRVIDEARKKKEFEGVEITALIGVDGAQDLVGRMKHEFDEHLSSISGFMRFALNLISETGNREDLQEVLFLEGTLALLQYDMSYLSGQTDGLDAMNELAREKLCEALTVADRPLDRVCCLNNLAKTSYDTDKKKSLEYLLQSGAEIAEATKAARTKEERDLLGELYLDTVLEIATAEIALEDYGEAYARLVPAIETVERELWALGAPTLMSGLLKRHGSLYLKMVETCVARGREDPKFLREALEYAEKRNGRTFLETLQKGSSFGTGAPQGLFDERERVFKRLEAFSRTPSDGEVQEIEYLMNKLGLLEQEIWKKSQVTMRWLEAVPATYDQIVAQVPDDGLLIEYCVLADRILAFVVDHGDAPDVVEIDFDPRALGQIVDALILAIDLRAHYSNFAELMKEGLVIPATAPGTNLDFFYRLLILPLARYLEGKTKVYIVPDGELRRLPFQALFREENGRPRFLIEDVAIAYAPTGSILKLLRTRRRALSTCYAAGVPASKGGPEGAEQEADMVARLFGTTPRLATVGSVRAEAGRCDVIHLSCHSVEWSVVTMYDGLQLEDGVLLPRGSFPVNSSLVTLSACNTFRHDIVKTEELAGMTGYFLRLGARSIVSSLWEVPSGVTCELMQEFYRCLVRTEDRALALQSAQAAIAKRYAHPFFWASFCLVGPVD